MSKPGKENKSAYKQSILDTFKYIIPSAFLSYFYAVKRQVKLVYIFPFSMVEWNK
jgi:hypothetical protein